MRGVKRMGRGDRIEVIPGTFTRTAENLWNGRETLFVVPC
jgi:hypothetical protein